MVGKLTAVLIRKEAEAYRAQGLHEEAFALYDELLSTSPNIDKSLKSDIQARMDTIVEEMAAFSDHEEDKLLTSKEIMQLKNGWGSDASAAEIMISAQDLCQIGAHRDALLEFERLLKAGIVPEKIADSAVECFVNLYDAKKLPAGAEKWLRNIYQEGRRVLAVHLLFLRTLSRRSDKIHALHYCTFIKSKSSLPADLMNRLHAAEAKYGDLVERAKNQQQSHDTSTEDQDDDALAQKKDNTTAKARIRAQMNAKRRFVDTEKQGSEEDDELRALFADDDEDEDRPVKKRGKMRLELHFFKIIFNGWFHRVTSLFNLPKKKKYASGSK